MQEYRYLLLDLDETILDFRRTEEHSLRGMMRQLFDRELTEAEIESYDAINAELWKRLERKEVTKDRLKMLRFETWLRELGMATDEETVRTANETYMTVMSHTTIAMPDAERACRALAEKYPLYIITNGTDWVQHGRMRGMTFSDVFAGVVISDEIGCNKPDPRFFAGVTALTGDEDVSHYLVIGDSLTSDIAFGKAIGADTMWVNGRANGAMGEATYTVATIADAADALL